MRHSASACAVEINPADDARSRSAREISTRAEPVVAGGSPVASLAAVSTLIAPSGSTSTQRHRARPRCQSSERPRGGLPAPVVLLGDAVEVSHLVEAPTHPHPAIDPHHVLVV